MNGLDRSLRVRALSRDGIQVHLVRTDRVGSSIVLLGRSGHLELGLLANWVREWQATQIRLVLKCAKPRLQLCPILDSNSRRSCL